jgi:hypothetical protein
MGSAPALPECFHQQLFSLAGDRHSCRFRPGMAREYRFRMRQSFRKRLGPGMRMESCTSAFCTDCRRMLATLIACLAACAASLPAQSSDPVKLQQIIAQKNAEAAAETWADWRASQTSPSPPAGSPAAPQPAGAPTAGLPSSGSSGSGSLGSAGFIAGSNAAGPASISGQTDPNAVVPANSAPPATQQAAVSVPALPATQSGSLAAPAAATPDPADTPTTKPQRARVTYADGVLDVRAGNSSLNEILRQIADLTGMKVTGGVAEERVFGNYGPAGPSAVITALLNSSGSSVLLRKGPHATVAELILIPRNGASLPSPTASTAGPEGPIVK